MAEAYLSDKAKKDLMTKYAIRLGSRVEKSVKIYHNRGSFKEIVEGANTAAEARPTPREERHKIVQDCIEKGLSYSETAVKYQMICKYGTGFGGTRRMKKTVWKDGEA